jgi:peptide/nickel transport system ATP-binding protein
MALATPSTDVVLSVQDLRTEFETDRGIVRAVDGISFSVRRGEMLGIVGESGSGKSATIRSILGLVRAPGRVVGGSLHFGDHDLRAAKDRQLRAIRGAELSYVPQNPFTALNPLMRVERLYSDIIRAHRRASRSECREMALEMMSRVGIRDPQRVLQSRPHELSGGMAQRVVIGLALVLSADLVLADEPTTGLDVTVQRQILDRVREVCREDQRSMVIVTHDLSLVAHYCDTVVVMYAGKIIESGPVSEVMQDPRHPYTAALIAASPRRAHELVPLTGRVPRMTSEFTGCRFAARCPYVQDVCRTQEPRMPAEDTERGWACHFPRGADVDGVTHATA